MILPALPAHPQDVAEALRRLPDQVVLDRNARLKRAMDLSLKGTFLPKDLQEKQTPFDHYLRVRAPLAPV
jgi:ubiquinol-cytochrome c reductase subunit 7